jgi:hypothetical protein
MGYDGVEKRRFPRADFSCKLNIFYSSDILYARVKNIGMGGIMIVLTREIIRGIPIKLELFIEDGKVIHCTGKVVWSASRVYPADREKLVYDTGIQFDEINEEDKKYIGELVDQIVASQEKEGKKQ